MLAEGVLEGGECALVRAGRPFEHGMGHAGAE
jgi:hypothetical protein